MSDSEMRPRTRQFVQQSESLASSIYAQAFEEVPPPSEDVRGKPLHIACLLFRRQRGIVGSPLNINEELRLRPRQPQPIDELADLVPGDPALWGPEQNPADWPDGTVSVRYQLTTAAGANQTIDTVQKRFPQSLLNPALDFLKDVRNELVQPREWNIIMRPDLAVSGTESDTFLREFLLYLSRCQNQLDRKIAFLSTAMRADTAVASSHTERDVAFARTNFDLAQLNMKRVASIIKGRRQSRS